MTRPLTGILTIGALLLLSACAADTPTDDGDGEEHRYGTLATWELVDPDAVDIDARAVDIGVTRIDCASGETGAIASVEVDEDPERITIRAFTEPLTGDAYECPGNDVVPATVELDAPIGERVIVDGVCDEDEASGTSFCSTDVRWPVDESNREAG